MSNISKTFKEHIVAEIKGLPKPYEVMDIELGEDENIALGKIGSISGAGTDSALHVSKSNNMLHLQIRNIAFLGSESSIANLAVTSIFRDLAQMFIGKEDLSRQDRMFHALALDAFTSRKKTVWELMAMIALEMNNYHLATRSVVDFSDGEVFVDAGLDCDFESVPNVFADRLKDTMRHAALLDNILRVVRRSISDEPASADECSRVISNIQQMLKKNIRISEGNVSAKEEKKESEVSLAVGSGEADEDLTI